jgi:hypothetical protein
VTSHGKGQYAVEVISLYCRITWKRLWKNRLIPATEDFAKFNE